MKVDALVRHYKSSSAKVSVVGVGNGDIHIAIKLGDMGTWLTNMRDDKVKRFRTPEAVMKFLEEYEIEVYDLSLEKWGVNNIYDKHLASTRSRKMKSQRAK